MAEAKRTFIAKDFLEGQLEDEPKVKAMEGVGFQEALKEDHKNENEFSNLQQCFHPLS